MKPSTKKVLITSAAGVALLATGAIPAFAAPKTGDRHPGGISGTVSAVSGSTITLAGANGTNYSVNAAEASVIKGLTTDAKPTKVTLSDIKVGDAVSVMGPVSGTNVTARVIFDGPVPAAARMHQSLNAILAGTITAVASSSLTVQPGLKFGTTTAPVTVLTTASTTILKDGATTTLASLAAGEHILVSGTKGSDGTITATKLLIRTTGSFLGQGAGKGHGHRHGHDGDADDDD